MIAKIFFIVFNVWCIISIIILVRWHLKIDYEHRDHKFTYVVFAGAFIGMSWVIGGGLYSMLFFIPSSWGWVDDGDFKSIRSFLSYVPGIFASFGMFHLLGILNKHIVDQYEKKPIPKLKSDWNI